MPRALHSMLVNSLLPLLLLGESRTVTMFYGVRSACVRAQSVAQDGRVLEVSTCACECSAPTMCPGWRGISFVCVSGVYVYIRMQMYIQAQEHTWVLGICGIDVCYRLRLFFTILCLETGSLPEPEAHGFLIALLHFAITDGCLCSRLST